MESKKLAALDLTAVLSPGLLTTCFRGSGNTSETPAGNTLPVAESGAPAADSPAGWTSVADLEDAEIAVQEDTTGDDVASAIPDVEVNVFRAVAQCGTELINGHMDYVIADAHPAQSLVDTNPDKLMVLDFPVSGEAETYVIATQKSNTGAALAEEFDTAVVTLQGNGTFDALADRYISKNEDTQLSEPRTVENPKSALVMDINCELEPFEYLDENSGPTGSDVGLTRHLRAETGYTLTIENVDFGVLIPAFQSGRIDSIAVGLARDEKRERNANFTDGCYEAIQSIVAAKPTAQFTA